MDSTVLCPCVTRPCGAMDSASDFGSESCGFESRQGLFFFFLFFRFVLWLLEPTNLPPPGLNQRLLVYLGFWKEKKEGKCMEKKQKQKKSIAGLEPAVSRSVGERLIHWAIRT
jgi:hypothetical protein